MKKITGYLFSMQFTGLLLAVFAVAMATATFIENDFGTPAARAVVYNSWWFELILVLGMINLTGNVIQRKLYRPEKFTVFLFHISFVIIILGAGITRYLSFEGVMHIREGESSGFILSEHAYIQVNATLPSGNKASDEEKVLFSPISKNKFHTTLSLEDKNMDVTLESFVANAMETIEHAPYEGGPVMELVVAGNEGRMSYVFRDKDTRNINSLKFTFNDTSVSNGVHIFLRDQMLFVKAPFDITEMSMMEQKSTVLPADSVHPFEIRKLYGFLGTRIVLRDYFDKGVVRPQPIPDPGEDTFLDALVLNVDDGTTEKELILWGKKGLAGEPDSVMLGDVTVSATYGSKPVEIPFAIALEDFILKRYPGSNSPSWFESKVILNDPQKNITEERRIYMNNVLKYQGYRFYQSSYDSDEKGTVLSVNKDFWGTWISYLGYFLLGLGMLLSIFNKNSRFAKLGEQINKLRKSRKMLATGVLMLLSLALSPGISAQGNIDIPQQARIDRDHASKFGWLLIQDRSGRIKPANTFGSEVLRKVARRTSMDGLNTDQIFLGMLSNPEFWKTVPMIRVSNDELQNQLGLIDKYAAFNTFFSPQQGYLLRPLVEEAYQKKPAYRNKFDNEVIKVDERVNISYLAYSGEFLRIFPKEGDETQTWYTPLNAGTAFDSEDTIFVDNIVPLYFSTLNEAIPSGDYSEASEYLESMIAYQKKYGADILPSETKVKLEILYNKWNIFDRLANYYGIIGFILLILHFIHIFAPQFKLSKTISIASWLVILGFVAHTIGLALRWYIAGHAPWSNGYEALVYIAWATILAGLIFARKSQVTLAATAVLSFLILHVAHLSWMDPEITTLVPVLKSYWLIIHVAIITASYGFLALGALLAALNLILLFLKTEKSYQRIDLIAQELSNIIEMSLIVGLYMLTIGTFLGGVWANESWGRYWGWDPKETWALVTIIIYAFIAHMRLIPGLRGVYAFNLMSLVGFGSVIMTYFGVNYYLSGLHSYAKGDPVPIPSFVYYTVSMVTIIALLAYFNHKKMQKKYEKG